MKRHQVPEGKVRSYTTPTGAKRWLFVIDTPPQPGRKRRQIKRQAFATQRAAKEALAALRHKLYEGKVPVPDATSTEAFSVAWLVSLPAEGLEPSTVLHYSDSVKRMLPYVGGVGIQDLDATHLDAAYAALHERGLSARSIRASHIAMNKMMKDAQRLGKVRDNATATARPPRARAARAKSFKTWTLNELRRFLEVTAGDPDAALWWLVAYTGMRRQKIPLLRWDDLDLDAATLVVRRAVGRGQGGNYKKATKSDSGKRTQLSLTGTRSKSYATTDGSRPSGGSCWGRGGATATATSSLRPTDRPSRSIA